jgi:hypothetical protein
MELSLIDSLIGLTAATPVLRPVPPMAPYVGPPLFCGYVVALDSGVYVHPLPCFLSYTILTPFTVKHHGSRKTSFTVKLHFSHSSFTLELHCLHRQSCQHSVQRPDIQNVHQTHTNIL